MAFPREYAEWNNNWWEEAGNFEARRVLLIGDSITNGYRNDVQNALRGDGILVDKLCGSRCAGDPMLTAEIELALGPLNGYTYQAVHFNNGLHGGCNDTHVSLETYRRGIETLCGVITRLQPSAVLILATITPMTRKGAPAGTVDEAFNAFVLERNAFLRAYAAENGLVLDDLYALTAGDPTFPQPDGVHFDADGFTRLGEAVARHIRTVL